MDEAGAGSSSKPTPTRPRLAVRVRGRPSSILPQADPAEWRSRPAVSWTVENIYEDFSGRRRALVGALTKDQEKLYDLLCDEGKERMCLYGYPDGKWSLTLPEKMLPPGLPEPKLGINRRPEYMNRDDYLSFVARHSDSWLMGVTLFLTTLLNAKQKIRLFDMVNKMSTVHDEFYLSYGTSWISTFAPPSRDIAPNVYNPNRDSSAPAQENMYNPDVDSITPAEVNMLPYQDSMQGLSAPNKDSKKPPEDKGKDHEATDFCGVCSAPYHANAFWICCDICDQWFHGKCVNITASESKHLKVFKCRDCILDEIGE
ncbi:hypothetical protein ZWY2020_041684 [Hordeum vulgare]|nr:hypothetical protein ZWY2020_041684 [Hordeum vulgare]